MKTIFSTDSSIVSGGYSVGTWVNFRSRQSTIPEKAYFNLLAFHEWEYMSAPKFLKGS